MSDEIVGHKIIRREDGSTVREPLTKTEADEILAIVRKQEARRVELMPDEESARAMFFDAWLRLKQLGWNDACYCPKDGSMFEVIEAGSSGIHACNYVGEWPKGTYWIHAEGDLWPSRPVLYRKAPSNAEAKPS